MRIKILAAALTGCSGDKLNAALDKVNGRASAHTARAYDVMCAADRAEAHLAKLGLAKKLRTGALYQCRSGHKMPCAYGNHDRAVTLFTLQRGASGWFLVDAKRGSIWTGESGFERLCLTETQYTAALAIFNKGFSVMHTPKHAPLRELLNLDAIELAVEQIAESQVQP